MRNRISLNTLIAVFSLLLLNSLPFAHSIYAFSNGQHKDIVKRMGSFSVWLSAAYKRIIEEKEYRQPAATSPAEIGRKVVTFADINWPDIKLPKQTITYGGVRYYLPNIREEFDLYDEKLIENEVSNENDARQILDEITEQLNVFRVEMDEWLAGDLEEKWRRSVQKYDEAAVARAKKRMGRSFLAGGHAEEQAESSSSRNIEKEEDKIDVHFLPIKINEKIYELNEQIWFKNYNEFFKILKKEMKKDGADIWNFYQNTLETTRNKIIKKELDKKILGILPKFWKKDAVKAFNKKIAEIVQKVRNKIDMKIFNEMRNKVNEFLNSEEESITGRGTRAIKKQKLIEDARNFLLELSNWLKGTNKIVNKNKLANLEADVAKQMEKIEINREEMEKDWNVSALKDIPKDTFKKKQTELGKMATFARNVVNEIETEIEKKYEDEATKKEIKRIYYTVLANRATMKMLKYMADEFEFVFTENGGPQGNEADLAHQQSQSQFIPLTEHSEIEEEIHQTAKIEKKRKFVIENLATISILAMDLLKNYLDKLNAKVLTRKFDIANYKTKSKLKRRRKKVAPSLSAAEIYIMMEEDNPLVQSIKALWPSAKYNNRDFNLFDFGMGQNELPENFIDRYKIRELGSKTEVRIIVDSMNLLVIFSRMKHLMEKTGIDKIEDHFKAGKIGLEIREKLMHEIENIDGEKIPQTFSAFLYAKYAESVVQNAMDPHSDLEQSTKTHPNQTLSPHQSPRSPIEFLTPSHLLSPADSQLQ